MIKIIIFCVLTVCAIMGIINAYSRRNKKVGIGIGLGWFILFFVMFSFAVVPAGSSGVKITLGAVDETVLPEGVHIKTPLISKIVTVNNKIQRTDVQSISSSKDLQSVDITVSVNYKILPDQSANLYKFVGMGVEDTIIRPAIQEAIKSITAKFTAEELITNRPIVSQDMKDLLQTKIEDYGISAEEFNIINFDFSDEFNKAIEEKQTAQQNALKAEQDLARIKVEAEQTVVKAKAEAEAYEIKNAAITDQMIKMEMVNKWNGEFPRVMTGSSDTIFDISSLSE